MSVPRTDTADLAEAIREFEERLPGWWWSLGSCSVSRDASCGYAHCGPDRAGDYADLLELREFDEGFHHDDREGTPADSLRIVMNEALEAIARVRDRSPQGEAPSELHAKHESPAA